MAKLLNTRDRRSHIDQLELTPGAKELLARAGLPMPVRSTPLLELRADGDGSGPAEFGGYAVKWNEAALIRTWFDDYFEIFAPGSWEDTIAERGPDGNGQIKLCYKHDKQFIGFGGGPTAGKITALYEDEIGARFEAVTIDTSTGRDLAVELRAETVDRMSFAFESREESWNKDTDPNTCTVIRAELYELSPVNWPAFAGSVIDKVRSEASGTPVLEALRDALQALREGKELTPSALRAIEDCVDVVHEIESSMPVRAGAQTGDAVETAGAVEIERCRFELERR